MPPRPHFSAINEAVSSSAQVLHGTANDHDALLELIGDARFVLLGEATHGTHEFYQERARITQRLITEKDFNAVAVEADWPDAWRVNRYVRELSDDGSATQALDGFRRFPTWMWRNADVVEFVEWLRARNASVVAPASKVGFYGLDLYSMFASIGEVLRYLDRVDPEAARQARQRYACFDHYSEDSQRYGYAAGFALSGSCEDQVTAQLRDLHARTAARLRQNGDDAADALFDARQNALLVANAEQYYRSMFKARISSWNLRDQHMAETLDSLQRHLANQSGKPSRVVVWEHNSHIGDARATEVGEQGEWTVGQLVRERYGSQAVLVGFTTSHGTVAAASDWDAPVEYKTVRPPLRGSIEDLFHCCGIPRFMLPLRAGSPAARALAERRLERAIGVIYRPETERRSHYFHACLAQQFDAVVHIDLTSAVEPLEVTSDWKTAEPPETFPSGV